MQQRLTPVCLALAMVPERDGHHPRYDDGQPAALRFGLDQHHVAGDALECVPDVQ